MSSSDNLIFDLKDQSLNPSSRRSQGAASYLGKKAVNLHWLERHGFRVPSTWVVSTRLDRAVRQADQPTLARFQGELRTRLNGNHLYAVRSSANLEDDPQYSFAGQFVSLLNIPAADLYPAILRVIDSAQTPSIQAYLNKFGLSAQLLEMAVIIQEMVPARVSGVAFSKNPTTGLDETVLEAVEGSGEALVQEGVTPYRWVNRWGEWLVQPEATPFDTALAEQVVQETRRIAREYGAPVDLEWVYDGRQLSWVQLRPITRLDTINIYSNRISREVFPGQIKPLVWSVNVPLVNGGWIALLTELIGPNNLRPEQLAKAFAYRAYFNMGALGQVFTALGMPRESLELLLGLPGGEDRPRFKPSARTWKHAPRMLSFLIDKWILGRRVMPALAGLRQEYADLHPELAADLDEAGLLQAIDRLYEINRKTVYFNIIVPLLMGAYNSLLRRMLAGVGVDMAHFDLTAGLPELDDYNPNIQLKRLAGELAALDDAGQVAFAGRDYAAFQKLVAPDTGLADFQARLDAFLKHFGHLSENGNDFSARPWRETPEVVMGLILAQARHSSATGVKAHFEFPFEGPHPAEDLRKTWSELSLTGWQRARIHPVYRRARAFQLYREAVSFTYTYGYGLFRVYFLELGRRLAQRGLLSSAEDIFYLTRDEATSLMQGKWAKFSEIPATALVEARRSEMGQSAGLLLPDVIYGDELPPAVSPELEQRVLTGIPSSRGVYRGPVRVVHRAADFDKLQQGEVLVIPYSDVAWTPLFSRAGAVIAEAGGMLSHSSIVAREYNLPCVVSVSGACRLPDGIVVSVDGYKGAVHIHSEI
jgi:pyruvate,water dikinase